MLPGNGNCVNKQIINKTKASIIKVDERKSPLRHIYSPGMSEHVPPCISVDSAVEKQTLRWSYADLSNYGQAENQMSKPSFDFLLPFCLSDLQRAKNSHLSPDIIMQ